MLIKINTVVKQPICSKLKLKKCCYMLKSLAFLQQVNVKKNNKKQQQQQQQQKKQQKTKKKKKSFFLTN